ncbi:MAG: hypothetical protein HKN03_10205, partial [Acidimicrobiales bacterium]|nr:hypothetical protein [Acidimicrobiales bacterium]
MNTPTLRAAAVLTVVAALFPLTTSADAQPGCGAVGHNDGSAATAAAWCLYGSDGVPLSPLLPLDCEEVSYELVVQDDSVTAVFPTQVIQNYAPALPTGRESAGFDNHFG